MIFIPGLNIDILTNYFRDSHLSGNDINVLSFPTPSAAEAGLIGNLSSIIRKILRFVQNDRKKIPSYKGIKIIDNSNWSYLNVSFESTMVTFLTFSLKFSVSESSLITSAGNPALTRFE